MAAGALASPSAASSRGWQDFILPVALVASVLVILAPLPPALLDLFLSINIALSIVILLTTVYVRTPLEFSIFPSLLLATTLARRLAQEYQVDLHQILGTGEGGRVRKEDILAYVGSRERPASALQTASATMPRPAPEHRTAA